MQMMPGKSQRTPPGFDNYMNSVRMMTTKQDHIKGFRFEVGVPLSN